MRRADNDLLRATEPELARLSEDELFRLVVICRDGDQKSTSRARRAWELLVARDIERVRGIVASFRFPGQGAAVHRDDVDDVTISAYERLVGMFGTFRGAALGQYRAALRQCVFYECMDHCRRAMEEDKKRAGSLDEQLETKDGGTSGRFDNEIAERELGKIEERDSLEREEERTRQAMQRLDEAIAQLDGNRRRVLELTRAGRTTKEIEEELGISRDNVYQLRRRALADLQRPLREDDKH